MTNKRLVILSVATATIFLHPNVYAATATATMTNTVTIANSCTVSATGFTTTYDPVSANATTNQDVTATVSTTCTLAIPAVLTLGQGSHAGAGSTDSAPVRRLSTGGGSPAYLNYSLYQDSARSVIWGNTSITGVPIVGTGASANNSVYARVPSGQTPGAVGTFTDSIVVTVTY